MPRLQELTHRESLNDETREVYDEIIAARGKLANSYAVMLHAPRVVARTVQLATTVRFESSLSRRTLELVALTVCSELDNPYEVGVHTSSALESGVTRDIFEVIVTKASLSKLNEVPEEVSMVIECARELVKTAKLSDASFAIAHRCLADRGVVELVAAIGFYSMLSLMQNALEVRPQNT